MEPKKSPKADLENKRGIFVQLGLVVSLGIVLVAFNWSSPIKQANSLGQVQAQDVEDEMIPITRPPEVKPPPPPPPPTVVQQLNIVDNSAKIDDELKIEDTEADDNTVVNVAPIVQQKEEKTEEQKVFFIVEDMPKFPGGNAALRSYIAHAIKYPVIAQENGIQGKVYVTFVVNTDGSVTNAKIARGVDPSLDKEALRVINSLPKWQPGKQRGKPVRVSFTVPINFVLQ